MTFGKTRYPIMKEIELPCKIKNNKFYIRTNVLEGDIPLLLGRHTMKKMKIHQLHDRNCINIGVLNIKNLMTKEGISGHSVISLGKLRPTMFLGRYNKNWILEGNRGVHMKKLHLQFAHCGDEKLFQLIKGAHTQDNISKEEWSVIKKECSNLVQECDICIRHKRTPPRPVVGLPMANRFNDLLQLDMGEINGERFLVMIDSYTKYTQACWTTSKNSEEIIKHIVHHWISRYGTPRKILSDAGREFHNDNMEIFTSKMGIELLSTAAESPWSNGLCEKTVGIIKESLIKLKEDGHEKKEALDWAIFSKNTLSNNKGFSPNQLVFGFNGNIPTLMGEENPALYENDDNDYMRKLLNIIHKARISFIENEYSEKIQRALRSSIREHNIEDIEIGEKVYYKRNMDKEWRGPAKIIGQDGKTIIVKHGGTLRAISKIHSTRIKKIKEDEMIDEAENRQDKTTDEPLPRSIQIMENDGEIDGEETVIEDDDIEENIEHAPVQYIEPQQVKPGEDYKMYLKDTEEHIFCTIINRAGKAKSRIYNLCYNIENLITGDRYWIDLKEYDRIQKINENDLPEEMLDNREEDFTEDEELENSYDEEDIEEADLDQEVFLEHLEEHEILKAKESEINNWKRNNVYEEVETNGEDYITTKWLVKKKTLPDGHKKIKARLVARGFQEKIKCCNDSPTVEPETIRILLQLALVNDWKVRSMDITTAYLQGRKIQRRVLLEPPEEYNNGKLWLLKKTVYGLQDAAKEWYQSLKEQLVKLDLFQSKFDPTLFFHIKERKLEGALCFHVDDILWIGSSRFEQNIIKSLKEVFQIGTCMEDNFKYLGMQVTCVRDKIYINQDRFYETIETPAKIKNHGNKAINDLLTKDYRSLIGKLNWLARNTRPDISFIVSLMSRGQNKPSVADYNKLIDIVNKVKETKVTMVINKLKGLMKLIGYSDSSFANLEGSRTQLGMILYLEDDKGNMSPITWKSGRSKRINRSVLEAETNAAAEAIENAEFYSRLWKELTNEKIDVIIRSDSKTMYANIHSDKNAKLKNIRINVAYIKEKIHEGTIQDLIWIPKEEQRADALTKEKGNIRLLMKGFQEERET